MLHLERSEERQRSEEKGRGAETRGAAETGRRCYAPLPGIGTPPWVVAQSHMPGISGASGFLRGFLEKYFRLVERDM